MLTHPIQNSRCTLFKIQGRRGRFDNRRNSLQRLQCRKCILWAVHLCRTHGNLQLRSGRRKRDRCRGSRRGSTGDAVRGMPPVYPRIWQRHHSNLCGRKRSQATLSTINRVADPRLLFVWFVDRWWRDTGRSQAMCPSAYWSYRSLKTKRIFPLCFDSSVVADVTISGRFSSSASKTAVKVLCEVRHWISVRRRPKWWVVAVKPAKTFERAMSCWRWMEGRRSIPSIITMAPPWPRSTKFWTAERCRSVSLGRKTNLQSTPRLHK